MASLECVQAAVRLLVPEREAMHARAAGGVRPAQELSRAPIDHKTAGDSRLQRQPSSTLPAAQRGAHR